MKVEVATNFGRR